MLPELIVHRVGSYLTIDEHVRDQLIFPEQVDVRGRLRSLTTALARPTNAAGQIFAAMLGSIDRYLAERSGNAPVALATPADVLIDNDFAAKRGNLGRPKLVAKLPEKKFDWKLDNLALRISVRLSLTACTIEHKLGRTKVWATIEALPLDGAVAWRGKPSEIVKILDEIANLAIPGVATALGRAFNEQIDEFSPPGDEIRASARSGKNFFELGSERLRITMADDFDPNVGAFLDAVEVEGLKPAQIEDLGARGAREKEGLNKFAGFVTDIDPPSANEISRNVSVAPGPEDDFLISNWPDFASVSSAFTKRDVQSDGETVGVRVIGLSQRSGLGGILRAIPTSNPELAEGLMRRSSGARLMTAYLASAIAEDFEKAHLAHAAQRPLSAAPGKNPSKNFELT